MVIRGQRFFSTLSDEEDKSRLSISSFDTEAGAIIRACISPACFWSPEHIPPYTAWLEHAPFAFWLIDALRPRTIVELGTHTGFSYFSFCQAVQRLQMETSCYAVDTWKGDEHAGFYGEEVFHKVSHHNDRYSSFSTLIRSTFDDASRHFRDGTIDLLHIDGRHFYDDVRHDFETWRAKLSDRGVVLLHDTNVRENNFGVFKFWKELSQTYPHFEFLHGNGLGVLGVGTNFSEEILALFAARTSTEAVTSIQRAYSRLGSVVNYQFKAEQLQLAAEKQDAELSCSLAERDARVAALDQALAGWEAKVLALDQALAEREAKVVALDQTLAERDAKITALDQALAGWEAKVVALDQALTERDAKITALDQALAGRDAKVVALDQALAERDAKITALDQALARRDAKVVVLDQTLAERDVKVAALDRALAERDAKIAVLDQTSAERGAKVAALDRALAERNSEVEALRTALAETKMRISSLSSAISTLNASTSWRITSPLRSAKQLLGRLRYSMAHHPLMVSWRALKTRALLPSRLWYATRAIAQSGLFERKWYLSNNPDVAAEGIDPIRHYVLYGAKERRDPSPTFSTRGYLSRNPDVAAAGANPLEHFIRYGAKEGRLREASTSPAAQAAEQVVLPSLSVPARSASGLTPASEGDLHEQDRLTERYCSDEVFDADHQLLRESGLFDLNNYRKSAGIGADIDAIEHYLAKGWQTGLEPSPDFQGELLYSYFRSAGYFGPPAITYLKLRSAGGAAYTSLADAEYWAGPIRHSNMFNAAEYVARFGKIDGLDPALHYVIVGEQLGLAPSDAFDPTYYRARYPDVAQPTISPLGHYLKSGFQEGRRPMSIATKLTFDRSGLDERRETILLISHDASRTGAPILVWNIAKELRQRYNIVALLLRDGELVPDFGDCCAAVVGPLSHADWHPVDAGYIVRRLLASYSIAYAIANSTESTLFVPALTSAFVPVVSLIHEFVSYTRPKRAVSDGLDLSTQIVFSADVTARSAVTEYPHLSNRKIHVLPQGQCQVPRGAAKAASPDARTLREVFRPKGYEDALVVLGAGFVHIRKGVDLFLSCAAAVAALPTKRPVRFVWIGSGYDLENDLTYSTYLGEQIARSGLEGSVTIIDAIQELEPAYMMTDVFFLSSRLDPLPNVTIDAAFHGLPVVCFESASGMATLLAAEAPLRSCVVPHLDVQAAARVIVELANDETARKGIGDAMRKFAAATFDMVSYVGQLDRLGREAIDIMRQREQDFITLRDDPLFDKDVFLAPASLVTSRDEAIRQFLAVWAAVGNCHISATKSNFRRPCAGFHPQIYAQENLGRYDTAMVNPFAHFIRSGRPSGPWWHEVLSPSGKELVKATELRTALHVHFYYPELVSEFLRKLRCNQSRCDLLLSTDTEAKAKALHSATDGYGGGEVLIRVVPNRGRDIGPFLEFLAEVVDRYDIIGHIHSKRSPIVGDSWRKFLWGNLVGDPHPMMDIILQHFSADARLGMVFPDDPHLSDWDLNREIAERLTKRMGMKEQLPAFFDFPIGTMFWARTEALTPLLDLELGWDDYPDEPVPYDGTILHALERLLPFVARQAGYRYATTNVSGLTR